MNLDGHVTVVDTINAEGAVPQVKLFEATCDGKVPNHRITLTTLERRAMSFDYFEYVQLLYLGLCELIMIYWLKVYICRSRPTSSPVRTYIAVTQGMLSMLT